MAESKAGLADVWICKDQYNRQARRTQVGCGYIGLYKPEYNKVGFFNRRCPSCGKAGTYKDTGERCRIEMEPS